MSGHSQQWNNYVRGGCYPHVLMKTSLPAILWSQGCQGDTRDFRVGPPTTMIHSTTNGRYYYGWIRPKTFPLQDAAIIQASTSGRQLRTLPFLDIIIFGDTLTGRPYLRNGHSLRGENNARSTPSPLYVCPNNEYTCGGKWTLYQTAGLNELI